MSAIAWLRAFHHMWQFCEGPSIKWLIWYIDSNTFRLICELWLDFLGPGDMGWPILAWTQILTTSCQSNKCCHHTKYFNSIFLDYYIKQLNLKYKPCKTKCVIMHFLVNIKIRRKQIKISSCYPNTRSIWTHILLFLWWHLSRF